MLGGQIVVTRVCWALVAFVMTMCLQTVSQSLPGPETSSLVDLYVSTGGDQWQWKTPYSTYGLPWNISATTQQLYGNPCDGWQGIQCSSNCSVSPCNVLVISLSGYGLRGTLPPSMGNFSELSGLMLQSNALSGVLPSSLGSLQKLLSLYLPKNQLRGTLPPGFGNISSLEQLELSNNLLTGPLPISLSRLQSLQTLSISSNALRGPIPNSYCRLTALHTLELEYNSLTGTIPWCIGNLTMLTTLYLNENHMIGTFPSSLFTLKYLVNFLVADNSFSRSIPFAIGNLTSLAGLDLGNNFLTGTIPESIGSLSQLYFSYFDNNFFTHTVPSSFQSLTRLSYIVFDNNFFTRQLPDMFGQMPYLYDLALAQNLFTGSIPASIGNCSILSYFYAQQNEISECLPSSMGNLRYLVLLEMDYNFITGRLPESFGQLVNLVYIDFEVNCITGELPSLMGNLLNLQQLYLDYNYMNGTLMESIGNLNALQFLNIDVNMMEGRLPKSLGNLSTAYVISLQSNYFTGKIPESVGKLQVATAFSVCDNQLTGTIPGTIANIPVLNLLSVCYNQFTQGFSDDFNQLRTVSNLDAQVNFLSGTFPSWILEQESISSVDIESNLFYGTLPSALGSMSELVSLVMDLNLFDHSIPESFEQLTQLQLFYAAHNLLTGSIPNLFQISSLTLVNLELNYFTGQLPDDLCRSNSLQQLLLDSNVLSGRIPSACSPSSFKSLFNFQLSNNAFSGPLPMGLVTHNLTILYLDHNRFTGSIPSNWFDNGSSLIVLALAINCLSGTIPHSICATNQWVQISLDGLHSSPTCERRILPSLPFSGTLLLDSVTGTIPECLLSNPMLSTAQFSGNALTGTLPSNLSKSIERLDVSNNLLSGPVPTLVWNTSWIVLDISFNRFRDTISKSAFENISANSSVSMEVNRLSGNLVPSLQWILNLNVLEGNMFACNPLHNNLPPADPLAHSYACGSRTTNVSLVAFGILLFPLVLFGLWSFYAESMMPIVKQWISAYRNRYQGLNLWKQQETTQLLARLMTILACASLLLLPMYVGLSITSSTFIHSYVWTASSAYLASKSAAGSLLSVFVLLTIAVVYLLPLPHKPSLIVEEKIHEGAGEGKGDSASINNSWALRLSQCTASAVFLLFNTVIIFAVNISYVDAVVNDQLTPNASVIVAMCMSIFKLSWNGLLLFVAARQERLPVQIRLQLGTSAYLMLTLFNNLIVPYLAEAFVSSNCFRYVIEQFPPVTFYIPIAACTDILTCATTATSTSCTYQLDCSQANVSQDVSNSVESSYIPPFHYYYQCSSELMATFVPVFVYRSVISGIVQPSLYLLLKLWRQRTSSVTVSYWVDRLLPILWKVDGPAVIGKNALLRQLSTLNQELSTDKLSLRMSVHMVTDVAIMLSFGILFPPLLWIIMLSLLKDAFLLEILLGRWLQFIHEEADSSLKSALQFAVDNVQSKLKGFHPALIRGLWMALIVASWFWAFALFDTLGDVVGAAAASWIVVVMIFAPLCGWAIKHQWVRRSQNRAASDAPEVEFQDRFRKNEDMRLSSNPMLAVQAEVRNCDIDPNSEL